MGYVMYLCSEGIIMKENKELVQALIKHVNECNHIQAIKVIQELTGLDVKSSLTILEDGIGRQLYDGVI